VTAKITIVGLGPGDPGWITREAWQVLEAADEVYVRTRSHGAWTSLPSNLRLHSFDYFYEDKDAFEDVYRAIVDALLALAQRPQGVVYAVPGDPSVGEATVAALRVKSAQAGLEVRLVHGVSFLEPVLELAGLDALDGLQVADGIDLSLRHHPLFHPDHPAVVGQLHSRLLASDVKLTLMNQYPPDHEVLLIDGAGLADATADRMPLHLLDQRETFGLHTCLVVPPVPAPSSFEGFQDVVAHLRAPDGCPWDREQTHESLRPHLLEEAYEALETLDRGDLSGLREELGDLLLQIVLQTQIATETSAFTMADVIAGITAKIVRRHPHVFGDVQVAGVDEVLHNWEGLKAAERLAEGAEKGLLDGVPEGLPAIAQAIEMQGRVARVGFDWQDAEGPRRKILEELSEVEGAQTEAQRFGEVGDLFFAAANYARKLGVDGESALREANRRFRGRFRLIETAAAKQGRRTVDMSVEELDDLWEAAKDEESDR
jgi:tetrapyrrole methylase family protein / MazG family protein